MTDIVYLGPFPPPTHGQSVATQMLYDTLCQEGFKISKFDTGGSVSPSKARRLWLFARGCWLALMPARMLYVSVNSHGGAMLSLGHTFCGRLSGKRIVLHHHSYRRIGRHSAVMDAIAKVAGPDALHLFNCNAMGAEFRKRYPAAKQALTMLNTDFVGEGIVPDRSAMPQPNAPGGLTLGHMCNLCEEKGLGRAIDIFRAARQAGLASRLVIAGPMSDDFAKQALEAADREFGSDLSYLGPVYGADKARFFQDLDVFVFPTWYADETVGIVNLEALASGVPVISSAQCCIPSALGDAGIALSRDADLVSEALVFLRIVAQDMQGFRIRARKQFDAMSAEQRVLLASFVDILKSALQVGPLVR